MEWLKFSPEIWVAFILGMVVRWVIRGAHIITDEQDRTVGGFAQRHWKKQGARMACTLVLMYYVVPVEWATAPPVAFLLTFSSDTLLEDLTDLAKKGGQATISKLKGGETPKE